MNPKKQRWWNRRRGAADPNPAASMALLQEVLDRPLDPGYVSAAQRRSDAGLPSSTGNRTPLLIVTSVLLGFLLTVAAVQLRAPDPAAAQDRADLVTRIEASQERGDRYAAYLDQLRADIAEAEQQSLHGDDPTSQPGGQGDEMAIAGIGAGSTAMVGPGVQINLDDAPSNGPDGQAADADSRVLAHDLVIIVNGMWAHGAEAIAINGVRLTANASIRHAGEAIVVDLRGLNRPYQISVIGPAEDLASELRSGGTGTYLSELTDQYGLVVSWSEDDEVSMPGGSRMGIRLAEVASDEDTDSVEGQVPR